VHKIDKESISKGEKACAISSIFWKIGKIPNQSIGQPKAQNSSHLLDGQNRLPHPKHANPACDLMQTAHN
jgi:hypothetical protein